MPPASTPTSMPTSRSHMASDGSPSSRGRKSTEKTEEEEEAPPPPSTARRRCGRPKRSKAAGGEEERADVDNEPTHYQDFDEDESDEGSRVTGSKKFPKYYIVKNEKSGRPTEVFRTDRLHALRQGAFNEEDSDEECGPHNGMIKLHDRWREEWNYGIQVPVNCHNLPNFETAPNNLGSLIPGNFELPAKYIGISPQTSNDTGQPATLPQYVTHATHHLVDLPERLLYNGDRLDEVWIAKLNKAREHIRHRPMTMKRFLRIMNALEVQCYVKLHEELLAPLHLNPTMASSEDDACDVCGSGDTADDQIVYCDNCNACFHLSCYGLEDNPPGSWSCQRCLLTGDNVPPCIMCPTKGGALKLTEPIDGTSKWCHVGCALWIPECRFADPDRRETVIDLDNIPDDRWKLKCCICDTREGCCIQCRYPTCKTAFHIGCAIRSGYEMRIEPNPDDPDSDAIQMIALCDKHRTVKTSALLIEPGDPRPAAKLGSDEEVDEKENPALRNLEARFFMYIDEETVCRQLKEDRLSVSDVYEYWKLKRHHVGGKPLISNPQDVILNTGNSSGLPNENSIIGRLKLLTVKVNHMYDKQRNLSYLVCQREKTKAELVKTELDMMQNIWGQLTSHVPLSDRATAQLVEQLKGTMSPAAIERVTMNERELLEDISSDSGDPQSTVSRRRHSYENTTTRVNSPPVRRRALIQIKQEIISDDEEPLQAGPSPSAPSNSANRRGRGRPPRKSLPAMMIASPKAPPTPRKKSPPRRRQSPDSDALSVELLPHVPTPRPPPPPPSPTRKRSTAKKAPVKRERKRITIKQEPEDDYMEESDTTESVASEDSADSYHPPVPQRRTRSTKVNSASRPSARNKKQDCPSDDDIPAPIPKTPTSKRRSSPVVTFKRIVIKEEPLSDYSPEDIEGPPTVTPGRSRAPRASRYLPMPTSTGEKAERRLTRSIGPPIFVDLTASPEPSAKRRRSEPTPKEKKKAEPPKRRSIKQELIDVFNADAPLPSLPPRVTAASRTMRAIKIEPPDDYEVGANNCNLPPPVASSLHIGPKRRLSRRNSDSTEASLEIGIDIPSHSTGGGGFRGIVKEEPHASRSSPRRNFASIPNFLSSLMRKSPEFSLQDSPSPGSRMLRTSPNKDGNSFSMAAAARRQLSST